MTTSSIELRRKLLGLVEQFPGLHLRELARQAGMSEAHASYHLDALVEAGAVTSEPEDSFRRFYAARVASPPEAQRELMALLRQRSLLQIILILLDTPGSTHQELTEALGVAKSTLSYHLGKLQVAGVVQPSRDGHGFVVAEPKAVTRLLLKWEPPPDVTERFGRLWTAFYAHRRPKGR